MKSTNLAFLSFLLFLPPAAAPAQTPVRACGDEATALNLTERAERPVPQDRLKIELRVDATGVDPARLQEAINQRLAEAIAKAKGAPAVTATSGTYVVHQEQSKGQPVHWHGIAALSLSGHDTRAVLALASALQQQGLVVSSLSYDVTPEAMKRVEDELSDQALTRLKERAERIAATLGLAVERLCDVTVSSAAAPGPRPIMAMQELRAPAAGAFTPISGEAGEAPVSVTVSAQLRLGPRR